MYYFIIGEIWWKREWQILKFLQVLFKFHNDTVRLISIYFNSISISEMWNRSILEADYDYD